MRRRPNSQLTMGRNEGTGTPVQSMIASGTGNTSSPSPPTDATNLTNGAVGANASSSSTANSGSGFGNALNQLYQTQPAQVQNPTLSGGQFPPGAPAVSGSTNQASLGPSIGNSGGDATSDAIHRLDYINGLPWNLPQQAGMAPGAAASVPGASVNGPVPQNVDAMSSMANGPAQPGTMPQLGQLLQQLIAPPGAQRSGNYAPLNRQPPPANLSLVQPSGVGGGGLR